MKQLYILAAFIFILVISACENIEYVRITKIAINSVVLENSGDITVNANVFDLGDEDVNGYGICYSTLEQPEVSDTIISKGKDIALGNFTCTATNLNTETKYYFRTYLIIDTTITYSAEQKSLTTGKAQPGFPEVSTGTAVSIMANQIEVSANLISFGRTYTKVINYGHCYSTTNTTPTIADMHTEMGDLEQLGGFDSSLEQLQPSTKYYIRAYATNETDTSYGEILEVTTLVE